jgi:hypothetical protein
MFFVLSELTVEWPKSCSSVAIFKQDGNNFLSKPNKYFTRIFNNSRSNMTMVDDFGYLFLQPLVEKGPELKINLETPF